MADRPALCPRLQTASKSLRWAPITKPPISIASAGAQVQLVTKRGQNQWHGTGYEYYLDNAWGANGFNNNASDSPKPSYHYNRFGGSIGGPIISKNVLGGKWYFFANYEGFRWQ